MLTIPLGMWVILVAKRVHKALLPTPFPAMSGM